MIKLPAVFRFIGITSILLASCVVAPQTRMTSAAASTACKDSGGAKFVSSKAYYLGASFDPNGTGSTYSPPQRGNQVPDPYKTDLANAFDAAPVFFKQQLCRLEFVFIDNITNGGSGYDWGFWEAPDQPNGTWKSKKYISIASGWWAGGKTLVNLSTHETMLNQFLVPAAPNSIQYVSAGTKPDTPTMALLSILGHEMGHIMWYQSGFIDEDYCLVNGTLGDFFAGSWTEPVNRPPRFRVAGAVNTDTHAVAADPSYTKIMNDSAAALPTDLATIYGSGRWFSLFSSVEPDEDLAETNKLVVLREALDPTSGNPNPLTKLTVQISTAQVTTVDVMTYLASSTVLLGKSACLAQFHNVATYP